MAIVDDCESSTNWKVFVQEHNQIDEAIKHEKQRARVIRWIFFFIDLGFQRLVMLNLLNSMRCKLKQPKNT